MLAINLYCDRVRCFRHRLAKSVRGDGHELDFGESKVCDPGVYGGLVDVVESSVVLPSPDTAHNHAISFG